MKTSTPKKPTVTTAIIHFLSSDLLQDEIQNLPHELQEIFDCVLDTHYGNCLETRRKMLRFKELATTFATALQPFTEQEIQDYCQKQQ
jgi:hypothetical protein